MDHRQGKSIVIRIVAAIFVCCIFANMSRAADLGRLFFSADERRIMNQKRVAPMRETKRDVAPKASEESTAVLEPAESVQLPPPKITGQVIRSSGNNTVWVNHYPQYKRAR
jgi:hypothetical protein